ncbi:MAG: Fe-S cluster assembly protein SufD [Coxiellaceae bacterium]|nr:MAG: Fe-S cluster assembly protein SufD [Coxiellaceae bacterium]
MNQTAIENKYRTYLQKILTEYRYQSPGWLKAWREEQLQQFLAKGFPSKHLENWKYTDLTALHNQDYNLPVLESAASKPVPELSMCLASCDCYHLVFLNGWYVPHWSSVSGLPVGVVLSNLATAWHAHAEYLQTCFALPQTSALSHLNGALMMDGVFLYVPPQVTLSRPVHIINVTNSDQYNMQHLRNVMMFDRGSSVKIINEYMMLKQGACLQNIVTQLQLGSSANVEFYQIQQQALQAQHFTSTYCTQQSDSQLHWFQYASGGRLVRDEVDNRLSGKGASCVMQGIYLGADHQHIDQHLCIQHAAAYTNSQQLYKGILAGKATGIFNGKVVVPKNSQHISAKQINRNLLLSRAATINTKPELEIYADDVKCAHGATVGQLDPAALFYLRSRGIDEAAAMVILTEAFAEEILAQVHLPWLRERLQVMSQEKLAVVVNQLA